MNFFNFKLTSLEKKWVLYDVGNSAWVLLTASILPILFGGITDSAGIDNDLSLSYYSLAISVATFIGAFIGPIIGALTDIKGRRKKMFIFTVGLGAIGCFILGFISNWLLFLILYVVVRVLFSASLVVNDAMLVDVTTDERMDAVSSNGYAWGYIGSVIPFLLSLGVILGRKVLSLEMSTALIIAFTITAIWWFVMSLPLYKAYEQKSYVSKITRNPFSDVIKTLKEILKDKKIFLFLLAFFFYIDGVYTIIDLATKFGDTLGLSSDGLLAALLVTQIVAFPASITMGKLAGKYKVSTLIKISIIGYFFIALVALFMSNITHFFVLAIMVGLFQGGIQALSRSYFIKIIPKDKSGEYFGIYDICGKGAAFLGTTTFALVSGITKNSKLGIFAISLFFVVGFILFTVANREVEKNK